MGVCGSKDSSEIRSHQQINSLTPSEETINNSESKTHQTRQIETFEI